MQRDPQALQAATEGMKRLSSAQTDSEAEREYNELVCHTLPAIGESDPILAAACRRALRVIIENRVRQSVNTQV